jgi:hypothetical protein
LSFPGLNAPRTECISVYFCWRTPRFVSLLLIYPISGMPHFLTLSSASSAFRHCRDPPAVSCHQCTLCSPLLIIIMPLPTCGRGIMLLGCLCVCACMRPCVHP